MQWESAVFNNGNARQPPELMHYGILGQKWGLRRFQNEDRSLTPAGKERYGRGSGNSKGKTGSLKKKKLSKEEAMKKEEGKDRSKWRDKDVSNLSDEELRRRNNRLNAERNYKENITPQWKKDAKNWTKEAAKAIFVTTAVVALAAVVAKNYKKAGAYIGRNANRRVASIKAANMLKNEVNRRNTFDNRGSEILGKHVGRR